MKSLGVFLFAGLLTIWTELPSAWGQRPVPVKLGTCPPDYIQCVQPETDECAKDSDCEEEKKCCYCHCAMRCVEPAGETAGTCPALTRVCPTVDPPNGCEKDSKCPENTKCCDTGCGKACVWPKNDTDLP